MNKLKKSLSVLLTLVMLFTTFCFFPLDLGAIEADAAVPGIKIVVPETLYLTPSTGASTSIQYYINNTADGSVSASQDTSAKVHITYPGAKLTSVSAKTSAAITLPASITGLVGTTFGSSATTATGTFSLPAGLNAGGTALVEWTFVFDVDGKTQTHYAYSVAYAPWYQPVGAAAKAKGAYHNTFASSILWVSGVHGYSDGDSNSRWYIQTANFIPMLGTITAPGNNNPDTNWIQSASNGLSATINYQSVEAGGVKYHARANSISPTANLTVDTSRYNNFNQIPNFSVGFMVTDRENANEGPTWYVSDFTGQTSSYYNGTDTGSSEYSGDFNSSGTKFSSGDDTSTGIKYNGTWNKAISGTASFRIKSAVKTKTNKVIDTTAWNNNFVNISVTGANKSTLRANVLNGTSYAKENYTTDTWNTYYAALKAAATNLCNPTSATVDTSALTSAEAGLHTNLTLDANGGALGAGVPSPVAMNVGAGTSVSFNNADVKDAFYATRTGYTFLGWSTDKNATTAPATVTVGFNDTVYAVWQANKYQVVFDNLVDYPAWNKAAGNGTVSDITDNGFTITSNDGAGESTSESPYFPVTPGKKYKVHMDITGTAWDVYIFFCDADGNWVDFKDGASNRYSTGGSTGVDPENAIFTAPDKAEVVKAKIRVDANGSNNTVRFENIRVFEVDNENADISYEAPIMVTYDQPFGTLPTPTRTGYEFQGWVDESGTPYASSTKVAITETLRLYSTWEIGTYTITFDTDGGTAIAPISGHYGDAVTKPADPTKDGYLFTGWDKTVPDTIPPENTTITATWSENSYAVFFDGNGQTGGTAPTQINPRYTQEIEIPECSYEKTGYTFSYWTTNKDGTGTKYYAGDKVSKLTTVRDGGVTLYAQWTVNSYNITYVYDNGTGETKVIPFDINATVNALAAPEKTGYTFAGWKVTSAEGNWELGVVVDEGVTATGMYGNVTLTAQWTVNEYTITFDTDGGTAVAPITQDFGTAINEPAAPTKEGYTFAGWENLPATMPADNITVTAIWTVNEYVVEYNANGGEGNVDSQTFKSTDTVTLRDNAFTKKGYHFIGWAQTSDGEVMYEGAASGLPAFTQAAGETITLYAVWEANTYTVTFDKNAVNATSSMDAQGFTYNEAQNLNANAFVNEGYTFVKWNTAPDGSGTSYNDKARIVNLTDAQNGNVTLYAIWEINTYTVTFKFFNSVGEEVIVTREGIEHGTAYSEVAVPTEAEGYANIYYNAALTLPADNKAHHEFDGWANEQDVITSDLTLVATYKDVAHDYYEDTNKAKPATCTETGIKAEYCIVCGFSYQEVINVLGHDLEEIARTATCTEDGVIRSLCRTCGATIEELLGAYGHNFGEVQSKEATCTESGLREHKYCDRCQCYFEADADGFDKTGVKDLAGFVIVSGGHKEEIIPAVDPTCTETGLTEGKKCTVCGVITVPQEVVDATGHSLGEYIVDVEATCVTAGSQHKECANCDYKTEAEVIDPLGHDEVSHDAKKVTCEEDGWDAYVTCKRCDYTTKVVIPATGHDYGTLIPEAPATCVSEGTKAHFTCSVCSKNFDENKVELDSLVIAKNDNHALATQKAKAPTCESYGWDEYQYCTREGCTYSTYVEKPALGHKYVGVVTTAATCTTKGVMTYTCENDNSHTYTEDIAALGHTFGAVVEYNAPKCEEDGNEAYKKCETCEKFFSEDAGNYATVWEESADAFKISRLGHKYTEVITAPTCTEGGYTTHTCEACGHEYKDTFTDATGHTEASPVVENNKPASCTEDGSYDEVVYCEVCDAQLSRTPKVHVAPGHVEEIRQENIQNATCTIPGSYDNVPYCKVCGIKLGNGETVTGVTLPHDFSEQIIDEAHKKSAATCYSLAVYYYDCADCTAVAGDEYTFEAGEYAAHTEGEAVNENTVPATCYSEGSYDEVVYCSVCAAAGKETELSRTKKTTEKIAHTPGTAVREDEVPATCYSEGSYNEVVYCSVCKAQGIVEQLSTTPKTIEKIAHTPGEAVREDEVPATCYKEGSYNEVVYCSVCEEAGYTTKLSSTPKTIATIAHTRGEAVRENVNDSTCYKEGSFEEVVYCSACVAANVENPYEFSRVTKVIGVKEHTRAVEAVEENIVDSTCYEEGKYDEVFYCSVCKDANVENPYEFSRTEKIIEKKAHTAGAVVVENEVAPTCYSEGSYDNVTYCSVCEEAGKGKVQTSRETITVDMIAHTAGAVVVENEVAPTCYSEGSYDNVTYCSVCEAAGKGKVQTSRETITVDMVDHTPAEAVKENIVAPKCEEDGSYDLVVYCSVCAAADKKTEISRTPTVDPMTGHKDGEAHVENNVPATCTVDGSYDLVVRCTVCNEITSSVPMVNVAPGHNGGETTVENDIPATCTVDGSYDLVVRCTVCNEVISRETKTHKAPGHKAGEAKVENNTPATCTVDGSYEEVIYCTVCGQEISRETKINTAPGHKAGEVKVENNVPATCTVNGSYEEVIYCTVCGEEISRETKINTAPGHKAGEAKVENEVKVTCTTDGSYDEVVRCTVCNEVITSKHVVVESKGHTPAAPVKENEIPATETVDGSYESVVYCEVCKVEISRETIITKVERTITFIMKDKTVEVKAYNGDTVALPDVADFTGTDGFIYKFVKWDKPVAVVNGDATYTAIYTEPADFSALDDLKETLEDILDGGYVEDSILEENKAQIEDVLAKIEAIESERNTLDKSEQSRVDYVVGEVGDLIDVIYPDAGSELVITGASVHYVGSTIDLKAVKMPVGTTVYDATWTSSDEKIVFFSNGKLYAIGTGTVTLTATRGILKASKTITVVEGGNVRGINFTSINNTHFIVEDYFAVYNSAIIYWSNDQELKFRVRVYQSFMFEDYIVYVNGEEVEADANGYYTIPAGSGDARVTIAGAIIDTGAGEGDTVTKWSFWEWLLQLFRKIADFFRNLFG